MKYWQTECSCIRNALHTTMEGGLPQNADVVPQMKISQYHPAHWQNKGKNIRSSQLIQKKHLT